MKIPEKILLLLSKSPDEEDYEMGKNIGLDIENGLENLCRVFPDFLINIEGKDILDYGCGPGFQSLALAKNGANNVIGFDINEQSLSKAEYLKKKSITEGRVEFVSKLEDSFIDKFHVIISHNSMEHFSNPKKAIDEMKSRLSKRGSIYITFGPLWFSPYGSHMNYFVKVPWVNLLFSERTVMNVRSYFRKDGATKYEEVESGLNRMTVSKFEQILSGIGMNIKYKKYDCVKGLDILGKLPFVRELFINEISCQIERE